MTDRNRHEISTVVRRESPLSDGRPRVTTRDVHGHRGHGGGNRGRSPAVVTGSRRTIGVNGLFLTMICRCQTGAAAGDLYTRRCSFEQELVPFRRSTRSDLWIGHGQQPEPCHISSRSARVGRVVSARMTRVILVTNVYVHPLRHCSFKNV